jgi:hypothetical protein
LNKWGDKMKQLKFLDEIYNAERIVQTADSITGYIGGTEVFAMRGVTDFTDYELLDGAEWDLSIESSTLAELQEENTSLKLALAEMAMTQQTDKQELQLALAEIAELISGGGENG